MRLRLSLDNKRIFSNFFSLSVLRGLNFIFPLITIPYLIRVLGSENFGLNSFIGAVYSYFQMLTDYGFNLSATRDISINRDNNKRISEIFSSIIIIKSGLLIISFVVLSIICIFFERFRDNALLYYISYIGLIGTTFFPVWFFQGIENMKYITYFNLISRTISTLLVFVVVRNKFDLCGLISLNSFSSLIIGFVSIWIVVVKFNVRFVFPKVSMLKEQLKGGWHIFISTFSINMYISSNTIILGILTNNTIVGYYSLVDKVITAIRSIAGVIFQAIYPYVCMLAGKSRFQMHKFLKRIGILILLVFTPCTILLYCFAGNIILLLSGERLEQSIVIAKILCFVPLIVAANIPAYLTLLAYNFKRSYSFILVTGSVINIILNVVMARNMQGLGTALSVLITELYITVGLFAIIEINHRKYSIFRKMEDNNAN